MPLETLKELKGDAVFGKFRAISGMTASSRTLVTIFWDMAVFFRLMILMMLTFVFAFLLRLGKTQVPCVLRVRPGGFKTCLFPGFTGSLSRWMASAP